MTDIDFYVCLFIMECSKNMIFTTFDNYINYSVLNNPVGYWSRSREETKFKVLKDLLNKSFIDKNLSCDEYLMNKLASVPTVNADEASRWMNENTQPIVGKPKPGHGWEYIFVLKEDFFSYPHMQIVRIEDYIPRYQFQLVAELEKETSIIYNSPLFFTLDKEWIEAAIWFYEQCAIFFTTKHPWPSSEDRCYSYAPNYGGCTSEFIDEFLKDLAPKYTKHPFLFNIDFNGLTFSSNDFYNVTAIQQLWVDRWKVKHQENVKFVQDAIKHLKSHLK